VWLGVIAVAVLVLGVSAPASFANFQSGAYSGTSSQTTPTGHPHLALKVNRAKDSVQVIFFDLYCPGLPGLSYAGLKGPIKPNGEFRALSPAHGFYGAVRGRFSGKKATGTVTYDNTQGCVIGLVDDVTWSANHRHN
jgi:hypothetical protein